MLGGVDRPLLTRLDTGPSHRPCGHTLENSRLGPGLGLDHLHLPLIAQKRCDALEATVWTHFQSSSCYFHLAKNKGKQNNNNYREKRFPENPLRLRAGLGSGDGTTALPQGRTRPRAQESLGGTGRGPEGTGDPIFSEPFCFTWRHRGSLSFPPTKLNKEQKGTADS